MTGTGRHGNRLIFMTITLLLIALLAVIPPGCRRSHAQTASSTYRLMYLQSTTGPAPKQEYPAVYKNWVCQVNTTGSPSETVLTIEGNLTGSYYTTMGTWTLSTDAYYADGQSMFSIVNMPVKQIRANLTTVTGGASPTVTVVCTGVN